MLWLSAMAVKQEAPLVCENDGPRRNLLVNFTAGWWAHGRCPLWVEQQKGGSSLLSLLQVTVPAEPTQLPPPSLMWEPHGVGSVIAYTHGTGGIKCKSTISRIAVCCWCAHLCAWVSIHSVCRCVHRHIYSLVPSATKSGKRNILVLSGPYSRVPQRSGWFQSSERIHIRGTQDVSLGQKENVQNHCSMSVGHRHRLEGVPRGHIQNWGSVQIIKFRITL